MKSLKVLALILSWLTLSPLFYYLGWRWRMVRKWLRIILLLISPLFLILYLIGAIWSASELDEYNRRHYDTSHDRLENITGVDFPEYKVVKYEEGKRSFTGDYADYTIVEFNEEPTPEFFEALSKQVKAANWQYADSVYSFNAIWGNGYPAPKGENDNDDCFIEVHYRHGAKTMSITTGMW